MSSSSSDPNLWIVDKSFKGLQGIARFFNLVAPVMDSMLTNALPSSPKDSIEDGKAQ